MNRWITPVFLALALASCVILPPAKTATDDQLVARAAFDFNCPANEVKIVPIDPRSRGVLACGQRGTYLEQCNGNPRAMGTECTWVLNNGNERTP